MWFWAQRDKHLPQSPFAVFKYDQRLTALKTGITSVKIMSLRIQTSIQNTEVELFIINCKPL
jgi:hypothetical protein